MCPPPQLASASDFIRYSVATDSSYFYLGISGVRDSEAYFLSEIRSAEDQAEIDEYKETFAETINRFFDEDVKASRVTSFPSKDRVFLEGVRKRHAQRLDARGKEVVDID